MIASLPRWVWTGGFVLAFVAGMVNTAGFLGFTHQGLSHLTGSTTLFSLALSKGDLSGLFHPFALVASFFVGALLSGFLVRDNVLKLSRRYALCLLIESTLLSLAIPFLSRGLTIGEYLACAACGLQNAMASTYSGAVLRTTHVTGMFTDLGIMAGQFLSGLSFDRKRVELYVALLSGFVLGGVLGAFLFPRWEHKVLIVPALLTGITGIVYPVFFHLDRRRAQR